MVLMVMESEWVNNRYKTTFSKGQMSYLGYKHVTWSVTCYRLYAEVVNSAENIIGR